MQHSKPTNLIQTIERVTTILNVLAQSAKGISLGDLAAKVALPKGTTHRLLSSLMYFDFVRQDAESRKYALGFKLVELGSSLALDDYGTGHSGLDHLQRYPIGTLKLDRAFIAPMLESTQSMQIVCSSIDLAHSLGMNVVAEGIETKDVCERLLELGCDFGQGWHFGKPAALQDLAIRYAKA